MIDYLILTGELLTAVFFLLGQLGRISFFNQQVSIYPYEVMMAVTLLFLLVRYRLLAILRSRFKNPTLLFFGALAVSFILTASSYSLYDNAVGLLYFIRLVFYTFHFIYLAHHMAKAKRFRIFFRSELYGLIAFIIVSSWLQYLFFPNLRPLLYEGWDPHLYRVFSFFFEPYLAGGALGLSLYFLYFRWHPAGKLRYLKAGVLFMVFVLIMLTFSRTVYLAALITAVFLILKKKQPLLIGGLIVLFILLAVLIPKPEGVGVQLFRTFSIETRLENAQEGINLWVKQPLFGVGYNRIRYKKAELGLAPENSTSHAVANYHSSFVTVLASGGLIGLVAYGLFLASLMKVSRPAFFYILFLSIISLGDNALLHPFMMFLFFRMIVLETVQSSLV